MPEYFTPGVYVEEISTLPGSVVPVSTAIPAFIGYTEFAGSDESSRPFDKKAVRINSFQEYTQLFGGAPSQGLHVNVTEDIPVSIELPASGASPYYMYYQLRMFFLNGGGPCYIISVGSYETSSTPVVNLDDMREVDGAGVEGGLGIARKIDEITLLVFPDAITLSNANNHTLYKEALAQCQDLKDRFTIMDVKPVASDDAVSVFRQGIGTNALNYGAAYYPKLQTTLSYPFDTESITLRVPDTATTDATDYRDATAEEAETLLANTQFLALLERSVSRVPLIVSPCGSIAGIYAQTDRIRGVFKSPANVSLNSVLAPTIRITDSEQQDLNIHTTGKSINAIRSFTGKGILVWGGRTLEGNSNEWRYISVRRFFIFAEESIQKALEGLVFEPNNQDTWIRVRGTIESFLTQQWQAGALVGSNQDQAFKVKVGLGETMNAQDILEGRLIIEVGMATARPAEFIILRFMHKLQEA